MERSEIRERWYMLPSFPAFRSAPCALRVPRPSAIPPSPSLEITQVRRLLPLLRRHQQPVGAEHVVLVADLHMRIIDRAIAFGKDRVALATVCLQHGPGPRQRIVDGRDLVVQVVRIVLADEEALL